MYSVMQSDPKPQNETPTPPARAMKIPTVPINPADLAPPGNTPDTLRPGQVTSIYGNIKNLPQQYDKGLLVRCRLHTKGMSGPYLICHQAKGRYKMAYIVLKGKEQRLPLGKVYEIIDEVPMPGPEIPANATIINPQKLAFMKVKKPFRSSLKFNNKSGQN